MEKRKSLKETLKGLNPETLDIDTFGKIIDKYIEDTEVLLLVAMEEGSIEPEISCSLSGGVVIQLYILLRAISKAIAGAFDVLNLDPAKKGEFIDGVLEMMQGELMKGVEDDETQGVS